MIQDRLRLWGSGLAHNKNTQVLYGHSSHTDTSMPQKKFGDEQQDLSMLITPSVLRLIGPHQEEVKMNRKLLAQDCNPPDCYEH